jgi:hypothetical protein
VNDLPDLGSVRVDSLRRWSENGLDELTVGVMMCVLGGIFLPGYSLSKAMWFGHNYAMIAPCLEAACFLAMALILKTVRARLIFPRTGYVVFRPAGSRIWMFLAFQAFAGAIAVAAIPWRSRLPDLTRAWGPAVGFVLAASLGWGAITYRLPQYLWLAGLALLLGGVTFAAGSKIDGAMWVVAGVGLAMASDGAVRMKRFLKTHPSIEDQSGEDQHG